MGRKFNGKYCPMISLTHPKWRGALICGHSDGWYATVTRCWPDEVRIRLWLSSKCAQQCARADCDAPGCSRKQHQVAKLVHRTVANSLLCNCWREFIPNRARGAQPRPRPQIRETTSAAVREIWDFDAVERCRNALDMEMEPYFL